MCSEHLPYRVIIMMMSYFIVPLFDFFPRVYTARNVHTILLIVLEFIISKGTGKKGYSRVLDCVFLSENPTTAGILLPTGEGVKRVGKLVKYDQLKKLNSSGDFFFYPSTGCIRRGFSSP